MARKTGFDVNEDGQIDRSDLEIASGRHDDPPDIEKIQALIPRLLEVQDLESIEMGDRLRREILEARRITSRSALRRQIRLIGKLMRAADVDVIADALADSGKQSVERERAFLMLERWRNRMLAEGDPAVHDFAQEHPEVDRQRLRQLVRQARKEAGTPKGAKTLKALFKALREAAGV